MLRGADPNGPPLERLVAPDVSRGGKSNIMRLIIGIFIAFVVAVVAYDLGVRLPLHLGYQLGIVVALSLASWALISSLSDDEHAHRH